MSNQRNFLYLIATIGLLLLTTEIALAAPLPAKVIARGRVATPKVLFKPPAYDKRPERTVGAGSRGGCPQDFTSASISDELSRRLPLKALVPPSNIGLTMAERPTFWMYLPQTSATQIVLSVQKQDTSSHSQWFFPVPSTAGIVSLQLPADAPPLQIGETYQWAAVLVCGERPGPNDPTVTAWVKRVPVSNTMAQSTAADRVSWNGEQGLWYDMLTALAQEVRSQPSNADLSGTWADVLTSEGLEKIALEPIRPD
jgi:hypothetical protein